MKSEKEYDVKDSLKELQTHRNRALGLELNNNQWVIECYYDYIKIHENKSPEKLNDLYNHLISMQNNACSRWAYENYSHKAHMIYLVMKIKGVK